MALLALQRAVRPAQGEDLLVVVPTEVRRHERLDRMAALAASPVRSPGELPRVLVAMAVAALPEGDAATGSTGPVAPFARHGAMTAGQRVAGQVVIEALVVDALPAAGVVARRALGAETARMRIPMAVRAARERQAPKAQVGRVLSRLEDEGLRFFDALMTLLALDLPMLAAQQEAGRGVVEAHGRSP